MADQISTIIETIENKISSYDGNMNTFYTDALEKIQRIKDLITNIRQTVNECREVRQRVASLESERSSLVSQMQELEADLQRARDANEEMRKNQNANEATIKQLQSLQEEHKKLQEEKAKLEQDLGIANSNIDEQTRAANNLREINQKLNLELATATAERDRLNEESSKNISDLEKAEAEVTRLKQEIEANQKETDGAKTNLAEYERRLRDIDSVIERLTGDNRAEVVQSGLDEILGLLGNISSGSSDTPPGPPPSGPSMPRPPTPTPKPLEKKEEQAEPVDSDVAFNDDASVGSKISATSTAASAMNRPTQHFIQNNYDGKLKKVPYTASKIDTDKRKRFIEKTIEDEAKKFGSANLYLKKVGLDDSKIDYIGSLEKGTDYLKEEVKTEFRKNVRKAIVEWQDSYTNSLGDSPFEGLYPAMDDNKGKVSIDGDNIDPFHLEFPDTRSKKYKKVSTFGGKRQRKRKVTKNNKNKSKNKTIKYKKKAKINRKK